MTKHTVEKVREFDNTDDAWAFTRACDETDGAVVAGYPSLTRNANGKITVRYFEQVRS